MKFTIASCVAALAAVVAAKPAFTNSNFEVSAGKPFELKWDGAKGPVTIELKTGPDSKSLKTFSVLASNLPGTSTTVQIPKDIPSGQYAFAIRDGEGEDNTNYSVAFPLVGTAASVSTSASSTSVSTTVKPSQSSTSSSLSVTATPSASSNNTSATTSPSSASTRSPSGTTAASSPTSTPPNNTSSGANVQSSLALVLLGAVALAFLN